MSASLFRSPRIFPTRLKRLATLPSMAQMLIEQVLQYQPRPANERRVYSLHNSGILSSYSIVFMLNVLYTHTVYLRRRLPHDSNKSSTHANSQIGCHSQIAEARTKYYITQE